MKIELIQHVGQSLANRSKTIRLPQYRILMDGRSIGTVLDKDDAVVCLTERFTTLEREEIEKQVAELRGVKAAKTVEPPEVPPDYYEPRHEGANIDDFDEG